VDKRLALLAHEGDWNNQGAPSASDSQWIAVPTFDCTTL